MAIFFKIQGEHIVFFGDTFNHRPHIKELGARFNATDKTWIVRDSDDMRQRAALIARPQGPGLDIVTKKAPPVVSKTASPIDIDPSMGLSISQLMQQADQIISQSFPIPIWIVGEIQSLNRRAGGTMFFDFADSKTGGHETATVTVKCNIWQNTMVWLEKRHGKDKIESIFVDGNRLRALVQVKLYKDRGQLSLTIEDIDPLFTQGALALARAELLRKLKSQGLDRKNKNLPIPSFPFRVALISAAGSRAQTDFEHQLIHSGVFPGELFLVPCTMQGENVPSDVIKSIKKSVEWDADIIVLSRGGGSAADLRWFDGEEIALAIANSSIPIIAAIGHHDDTCIAEEICHTREKTPTAAADFILELFRNTRTVINERAHVLATALDREVRRFDKLQGDLRERLSHSVEFYFTKHRERLNQGMNQLQRAFDLIYSKQQSSQIQYASQLHHLAHVNIQKQSEQLYQIEQKLIRLDPGPWLDSGWTQLSIAGKNLKNIDDTKLGDLIQARLRNGLLKLRVEQIDSRTKD